MNDKELYDKIYPLIENEPDMIPLRITAYVKWYIAQSRLPPVVGFKAQRVPMRYDMPRDKTLWRMANDCALYRDRYKCVICGKTASTTYIPNEYTYYQVYATPRNILTMCPDCIKELKHEDGERYRNKVIYFREQKILEDF